MAMALVGTDVGWDLRHSGGPLLQGLNVVAFIHESPHGFSESVVMPGLPPYQVVLDVVDQTAAYLDDAEAEARRRRRNPLYWADRVLRALLGLPAYLVSLVFRVPLERVEQSPVALPLRLLGLVLEIVGIVVAGRAAGWW